MTLALSARASRQMWAAAAVGSLGIGVVATKSVALAVLAVAALAIPVAAAFAWREPRWAAVMLVAATFADVPDALRDATGIPVTVRAGLVAILALLLIRRAPHPEFAAFPRRPLVLVALSLAVLAVSGAAAADAGVTVHRIDTVATAAGVALLIVGFLSDPPWIARAAWAVAGSGAFLAVITLVQQATHAYSSTFGGLARVKFDGSVARSGGPYEPNFFAQALILSAALGVYLAIRARSGSERVAAIATTLLCLAGIAATSSRGGAIAVLVVVGTILVLRRPRPAVMLALAGSATALAVFALPPQAADRLTTVVDATSARNLQFSDTSIRGRVAENLAAVRMLEDRPLLGVGAGNFPVRYADYATFIGLDWRPAREAHNLYLETLAETGLVGGCALAVFLLVTASGALRASRAPDPRDALLAEGAFVGMVGVLVTGIFLHGAYPHIAWTAFGLAWAVWSHAERGSRSEPAGARSA